MVKIPLEKIEKFMKIFLTAFAVYLIYQILKRILGGSWALESIILGILFLNTAVLISLAMLFMELKSDHKHLKHSFHNLATDFKRLVKGYDVLSVNFESLSKELKK